MMINRILLLLFFLLPLLIPPVNSQPTLTESGNLSAPNQVIAYPVLDSPYEKKLMEERMPLPYDHIREADIFWEKRIWRVIDTREKMNQPFRYPQNPFAGILVDAVLEGRITAYSAIDDKFSTPVNPEDLRKYLNKTDTVRIVNPDTDEERLEVVYDDFNPDDVKRFRIKEVWFFDEETSTLQVRILGVAPLIETYDEWGNLRFETPLFWAYYPELRKTLCRTKAFNPFNDAVSMSWEDIFEMRYFSSMIWKESNVYDRRIEDYMSGADRVRESEKIKQGIFEFEHDLWSY